MPLYEYRCKACGHRFEKIQSFSAPDEKECPVCHGEVERLISAPAVQFKGSGFYSTDYPSKSSSAPKSDAGAGGSKDSSGGSSEGGKDSSSSSSVDGAGKSSSESSSSAPAAASTPASSAGTASSSTNS